MEILVIDGQGGGIGKGLIENIKKYGLNPVIAINKFETDKNEEIEFLNQLLDGKVEYSLLDNWKKGGRDCADST